MRLLNIVDGSEIVIFRVPAEEGKEIVINKESYAIKTYEFESLGLGYPGKFYKHLLCDHGIKLGRTILVNDLNEVENLAYELAKKSEIYIQRSSALIEARIEDGMLFFGSLPYPVWMADSGIDFAFTLPQNPVPISPEKIREIRHASLHAVEDPRFLNKNKTIIETQEILAILGRLYSSYNKEVRLQLEHIKWEGLTVSGLPISSVSVPITPIKA